MGQKGKVEEDKLGTNMDNIKGMNGNNNNQMKPEIKMDKMIQRAIVSAQKHNIKLEPGTKNSGGGNCSYLSVIHNINDRKCFQTKYPMSADFYRRIWNVDLMNKILDNRIPWNPGLTRQEIKDGFQELTESGVYERSFFGDMMLAGIACGVKKIILIFNTNEKTLHDPISVVDPRDYSGDLDSEIPVVVGYNMVHFESLHPVDENDIQESVKLVNSYSSGSYKNDYGFTSSDMQYLFSERKVHSPPLHENVSDQTESPPKKRIKCSEKAQNIISDATKKNEKYQVETEDFIFEDIRFKENENGKISCGVCKVECIRLVVHMNSNKYCTEYFSDMGKFKIEYSKYRDRTSRRKKSGMKGNDDQDCSQQTCGKRKQSYESPIDKTKIFKMDKDNISKAGPNYDKNDRVDVCFKFGGFHFKELGNEKIRCGICQAECGRLVVHMNKSINCAKHFCMPDFKKEYSKYRHRQRVKKSEARLKDQDSQMFRDNHNLRVKKNEAKLKAEDPETFRDNLNLRVKKTEAKLKEVDPETFRNNLNLRVKKTEAKLKGEDPESFRDNHKRRVRKNEAKLKSEDLKSFRDNHNQRVKKNEAKQKTENPNVFKEKSRQRKERSNNNVTPCKRLLNFRRKVQFGPIFICSCCHQKLFENQVEKISAELKEKIDKADPEIRGECIEEEVKVELNYAGTETISSYLCKSCIWYLIRGRMPKLCTKNGLNMDWIEEDDKLTELENNLIARNIIFQKIHKLPKSRWSGTHDRLVNVPVGPEDILNTVERLPRTPAEAGIIPIIPVNLKRKLEYKTTHLAQLIDTNKIFKYLKYLKEMGHPGYKFYDDLNTYEKRCLNDDPTGAKLVFPEAEEEIVELEVYLSELKENEHGIESERDITPQNDADESDIDQKEEEELVRKDPIRKFQYDYTKSTCMTNKFPEADFGSALDFAPAEGKIPTSILKDKDWDINSFPNLHPTGQNKMFQDREITLTPQQYLGQRLKNKDTRFEQCTPYVFAAAAFVEEKQMERNIGVSYNRGKKCESSDGSRIYELDDAFSVLDNIKGTPKYWRKAKCEMLGKIDNFGPFHWFYTLSCADMRWDENFTSILREKGYKIIWEQDKSDEVIIKVEFLKAGKITKRILKEFLEEECDESLHEFIRTNVFTATRNFVHRVKAFRTEMMMGKNNRMRIKYWSDRMEFQGRGAGHIHGVAWCDLKEVSELIKEERKLGVILSDGDSEIEEGTSSEDVNHLENAYRNLRENKSLSEDEEKCLIDFVDRSVTCTLNPELAAKMVDINKSKEDGMKIIEIVKAVQVHYHTKSCKKHGCTTSCRFRFPKFPMWETILTKTQVDDEDPEARNERLENHKIVLKKVMDLLEEPEVIDEIMGGYDKENESIEEYRHKRKERIFKVLEMAEVDPADYVTALKESSRKGINVILARDIDELYVNNYSPEYIEAWNGNIDWSPVFDFFAVVTYVTEYFTKDESGTTSFLAEASKQIKNLPVKDQKRCIKNVFLTHRQMGLSEAIMKIFPEIRLKDSNICSVFVPLGKKGEVSRFLMRADPDQDYGDVELIEISDREGLYYEKPNWVEKYLRRDQSEWNELCFPQYVKMFDPTHNTEPEISNEEKDEDFDRDQENEISEDQMLLDDFERDKIKYGQEVKFHYLITETGELGKPLPKLLKIENPYPGEPKFLRKRKHPKSLRFYKVKRELNPARFFLHELMMYRHFGKEEYERWQDDENCIADYEKYKKNIRNVKAKVMEWMEDVEEARYFVEEVMKNELDLEETGYNLDPEMNQEDIECDLDGLEEDEEYKHLDPDGLKDRDIPDSGSWYRKLEMMDQSVLEQETCKLDKWQRQVIDVALRFVRGIRKFANGLGNKPQPENLVVIGGAGSGKSTVIECLTQWCHRILEKTGDDPNSPYILKAATTGAASSLIEGSTVHSCLGFDFSSKHTSLSDKKRELKVEQLKNLKILIIDEFSMLKADILYRIHLRLSEIKHNNQYFGGVLVMLFGDPAQLKPVRGSYIFSAPNCRDYKVAYGDGTDSLWRSFNVINLEENHRQGKDKSYADMLNRIRVGNQTQKDIEALKSRVRKKGHPDLKGALFISAKVIPVARFNEMALNKIPGKLYVSKARHMQALSKSYKPRIDKKSGRIGDTQYVDELNLKKGARVMLIFNIDVSDLLCNGAIGTVLGIEEGQNGTIAAVVVKFDNPETGKQARDRNPTMAKKYPNGTIVKKTEREYSLARQQGLISSTAKLIQFPLVLAWAVTVHKFQGQTVKSPQKVVIDLRSVFEAAQGYVMASRVQELDQLYILEDLPKEKFYANQTALTEIERLVKVSLNNNPTKWMGTDEQVMVRVSFLNTRSIKNKFQNILTDISLMMSDVIMLTETWLDDNDDANNYKLQGYEMDLNKIGRGKGMATYFRGKTFKHERNINGDGFSLSKVTSEDLNIIGVYRSQNGSVVEIIKELQKILDMGKITLIGGDFNLCVLKHPKNHITASLEELGFNQLVTEPTHIEGGAIDHIYKSHQQINRLEWNLEYCPKYYSDHDGLYVTICSPLKDEI